MTQEVADAAALGDRSENAEYIYGKKRLREIDSRMHFLNKRLEDLTVVDAPPDDRERVFFGAWVTLEDEDGDVRRVALEGLGRCLHKTRKDPKISLELGWAKKWWKQYVTTRTNHP